LEQTYHDLSLEYKKLSIAHEAIVEKWRSEKEAINAWHTWSKERSQKRKRRESRKAGNGQNNPLDVNGESNGFSSTTPNDAPVEKPTLQLSKRSLPDPPSTDSSVLDSTGSSRPDDPRIVTVERISASWSTDPQSGTGSSSPSTISQGGNSGSESGIRPIVEENLQIESQLSEDIPVVVMERPVKRQRQSEKSSCSSTNRSESTLKIKVDPDISTEDSFPVFPITGSGESLDLDEYGPRIRTPKKLRDFTRRSRIEEDGAKDLRLSQNASNHYQPHTPRATPKTAQQHPNSESSMTDADKYVYPHVLGFSPQPVSPSMEPFRALPLRRLGLNHFKVNPNYNQGLDFAFTETVRNREQRKCLSGCTKPGCCGDKFRRILEIGGIPTPPRSALQWRSQGKDEEQELLADYQGQGRAQVEGPKEAVKQEELLQAWTKKMANQFGKHRHAYERARTPPGFWRAGMPSTQELDEDKKEAFELERKKVEERYREAMRAGGKWLFRDE
jgi:hypothetical protein